MADPEAPDDDEHLPMEGDLLEAFLSMDIDGSGELTINELQGVLKAMGQLPSEQETHDLMQEVDEDGSGSMDFEEFSTLMSMKLQHYTPADEIHKALKTFDTSKKIPHGIISIPPTGFAMAEDLATMLVGLGMKEDEAAEVLLWCRPDKEGLVDYGAFVDSLMAPDPAELFQFSRDYRRTARTSVRKLSQLVSAAAQQQASKHSSKAPPPDFEPV